VTDHMDPTMIVLMKRSVFIRKLEHNNFIANMKKKHSGFTLIELLIVIVILGILSVIGLGAFTSAQMKSRDSNRKSSLSGIVTALEVYYNDYGNYPTGDASGSIEGCAPGSTTACSYGSIWKDGNDTTYMVQIPEDPRSNSFFYDSDGTSYIIYARLENVNDGAVPLDGGGAPGIYSAVSDKCGGSGCNYGVASSNTTLGSVETDPL